MYKKMRSRTDSSFFIHHKGTIGDGSVWYRFAKHKNSDSIVSRCPNCNSIENGTKQNRPQWYHQRLAYICS